MTFVTATIYKWKITLFVSISLQQKLNKVRRFYKNVFVTALMYIENLFDLFQLVYYEQLIA